MSSADEDLPREPVGNDPVPGGWATRIVVSSLLALRTAALGLPMAPDRVRSGTSGPYLSIFKGRGVEFAESRPYQAGDEVRHMDWRVTARTGKPHTKLFHEDRERTILLWVDLRPSLFFATRGTYKAVLAARCAALVAWGAALQGDRLGGLLFTDRQHWEMAPLRGDHGVLHLIGQLAQIAESTQAGAPEEEAVLEAALVRLRRVARPGSRIFLFSDFSPLGERDKLHLAQLARRNDLLLISFYDPLERTLPPPGCYPVRDGQRTFLLESHSASKRRQYQEQFQQRQQALARFCHLQGIFFLPCSTEEDAVALLQRTLGMHARPKGHGHGQHRSRP
ncbi:MAG: DUF58 domain-containing protein [Magnetococcales bacterium]|nr:DUF58 domain-containing protein [Magnetococcales bacterium]